MASHRSNLSAAWLHMVSFSAFLTTSLASDLAAVGSLASLAEATAVNTKLQETSAKTSALAAGSGNSDIPTSIISTIIVTVKPTPTNTLSDPLRPLIDPKQPGFDSPAIAAPLPAALNTPIVAAQAGASPETDSPFDNPTDPSPRPFPLGGGHGPVVPSSNPDLIFTLPGSSSSSAFNAPVQTVYITTAGNGVAATITSYVSGGSAGASPGLAGDRDSSAMTTSVGRTTTFLTVSGSAVRGSTTITAAGVAKTSSLGPGNGTATAKPSLVKNGAAGRAGTEKGVGGLVGMAMCSIGIGFIGVLFL